MLPTDERTDQPTTRHLELLWADKNDKVVELVGGGSVINGAYDQKNIQIVNIFN